jgi:hopanoid biosynthesis associated protein HpnK
VRRLIVNADDFGLTSGVNRAIVEAHKKGIVTSATLMANGSAFADAIRLSASTPRLSIGCHVVLVDGCPVLRPPEVPSLIQNHRPDGHFYPSAGGFALRNLLGRSDEREIESEVVAQITKLQAHGISISHLDTHKHTHIFPQVIRPLLRAAKQCGIRAVRNPFELIRISNLRRPDLWKRALQAGMLRAFARRFKQAAARAEILTPDGTLGIVATGVMDESMFEAIAKAIPEGTWEFVCHPGYNDQELQRVRTRLRESRERELRMLTSPTTRDLLAAYGIELMSYGDFVQSRLHGP